MFGKTKELNDIDSLPSAGIFGDEDAAERESSLALVRSRVEAVESQLHSQFTSMAAYAQIAQEQVEIARSEARAENERLEHRLTGLIERERTDRLATAPAWTADGVAERLDTLERSVDELQASITECLSRQKALADAIAMLFDAPGAHSASAAAAPQAIEAAPAASPFPPPAFPPPAAPAEHSAPPSVEELVDAVLRAEFAGEDVGDSSSDGPIVGLSLL